MKRALAALALSLAGCGSGAPYSSDDLSAPTVDMSGKWCVSYGSMVVHDHMYVFRKKGAEVEGWRFVGFRCKYRITGTVTGRVLQGKLHYTAEIGTDFTFVVKPDGKTAVAGDVYDVARVPDSTPEPRPPAATAHPKCSKDPALSDALILSIVNEGVSRECVAKLRHVSTENKISRIVAFMPLDESMGVRFYPIDSPYVGCPQDFFLEARAKSPFARKHAGKFDGKPCWWVFDGTWPDGAGTLPPTLLLGELYREDPDTGALPTQVFEIGTRADGKTWRPTSAFIESGDKFRFVQAVIENGQPARVEVVETDEPPLEGLLVAKESDAAAARWRTRMLLVAKTKTLPKLLSASKTPELSDLAIRIEGLILDLNTEAEKAKDQAQKLKEQGAAGAEAWRDLSLAYKERIEVLKAILAAIKEEIAGRGK